MKMLATEDALCEHLPKMAAHSTNPKLREALSNHWEETMKQRATLVKLAQQHSLIEEEAINDPLLMMIDETEEMVETIKDSAVRDAYIVAMAQVIEQYEIIHYNTLLAWSEHEYPEDNDKFSLIVAEEEKTFSLLQSMATGGLFSDAVNNSALI